MEQNVNTTGSVDLSNLITLKEYARRIEKDERNVRKKAQLGKFKTAIKIGRDWFINPDEPYIDERVTSGKWIGRSRNKKK